MLAIEQTVNGLDNMTSQQDEYDCSKSSTRASQEDPLTCQSSIELRLAHVVCSQSPVDFLWLDNSPVIVVWMTG